MSLPEVVPLANHPNYPQLNIRQCRGSELRCLLGSGCTWIWPNVVVVIVAAEFVDLVRDVDACCCDVMPCCWNWHSTARYRRETSQSFDPGKSANCHFPAN